MGSHPKLDLVFQYRVHWKPHVKRRHIEYFEDMMRDSGHTVITFKQPRYSIVRKWVARND